MAERITSSLKMGVDRGRTKLSKFRTEEGWILSCDLGWGDWIGCEIGSLPSFYLCLPLGNNPKSVSLWDPVVDKVRRRLASWKKASFLRRVVSF